MSRIDTPPAARATRATRLREVFDLVVVTVLVGVAVIGFGPTFDGPEYLATGFGAIGIGLAIAFAGARLSWGPLLVGIVTIGSYFVFGGALTFADTTVAGVVPTLDTWRDLALGVVQSWKDLLTTVPPVAGADGHLVVPFVISLVSAVLAASLALRVRPAVWAVLPALAALAAQILMSVHQPAAPLVQGIAFAVVAMGWLAYRTRFDEGVVTERVSDRDAPSRPSRKGIRRLAAAGVVLALAAGAGVAVAAVAAEPIRTVLRDYVLPPFNVRDYPSPLQSFRGIVRDDAESTLFTVTGLPDNARVRLATMDQYTGVVYNVSDEGTGSSGTFSPTRSNMSPDARGEIVTATFEIGEWDSVWLPSVGYLREIAFTGDRAGELRATTHYNDATGTAIATAGLGGGDSYVVTSVIPRVPSDAQLAGVDFAPVSMPDSANLPQPIVDAASAIVENFESPIERARALQSFLATEGKFSHGLEGEVTSLSGHGLARILTLIGGDEFVGDDEQYAVAMALMARSQGIPARVVMGWFPADDAAASSTFVATGDNVRVWVEIAFENHGWVPFDRPPTKTISPVNKTVAPKPTRAPRCSNRPRPLKNRRICRLRSRPSVTRSRPRNLWRHGGFRSS